MSHAPRTYWIAFIFQRYPDALDFADASLVFTTEDARAALAWADLVIGWTDSRIAAIALESES